MSDNPKPNGQPDPTPPEGTRNRTYILDSGADVVLTLDAPNLEIYDDVAISEFPNSKDAARPAS